MKKLFCILFLLLGIGAVVYILTQKQSEARALWNEALAKVPGPNCCCDCSE